MKSFAAILMLFPLLTQGDKFSFRKAQESTPRELQDVDALKKSSDKSKTYKVTLRLLNLAAFQPFSGFAVVVHNDEAAPIYVMGKPASPELAVLAEDGNPGPLVAKFNPWAPANEGKVYSATATGGPTLGGGAPLEVVVYTTDEFPLVSLAAMAVNTNDCIVTMNRVEVYDGMVLNTPGLDAGTEINNQDCGFIPGPACPMGSGNARDPPTSTTVGEGFVHVHPGIFAGVGNLMNAQYTDWRNPMLRIMASVEEY